MRTHPWGSAHARRRSALAWEVPKSGRSPIWSSYLDSQYWQTRMFEGRGVWWLLTSVGVVCHLELDLRRFRYCRCRIWIRISFREERSS